MIVMVPAVCVGACPVHCIRVVCSRLLFCVLQCSAVSWRVDLVVNRHAALGELVPTPATPCEALAYVVLLPSFAVFDSHCVTSTMFSRRSEVRLGGFEATVWGVAVPSSQSCTDCWPPCMSLWCTPASPQVALCCVQTAAGRKVKRTQLVTLPVAALCVNLIANLLQCSVVVGVLLIAVYSQGRVGAASNEYHLLWPAVSDIPCVYQQQWLQPVVSVGGAPVVVYKLRDFGALVWCHHGMFTGTKCLPVLLLSEALTPHAQARWVLHLKLSDS